MVLLLLLMLLFLPSIKVNQSKHTKSNTKGLKKVFKVNTVCVCVCCFLLLFFVRVRRELGEVEGGIKQGKREAW